MSTSFYNLFQNFVISVSTRNYTFILKRLSTNIDFIQCLLTNKQSLRTTVQILQYKELRYATPNFKILQTFFYLSLYGRFLYLTYYIQYLLILSIINLNWLTIYAITTTSIPLFFIGSNSHSDSFINHLLSYMYHQHNSVLIQYIYFIQIYKFLMLPISRSIGFILYRLYLIWHLFYKASNLSTYIKTTPSNRMALFNKDLCSLVGGPGYRGPHKLIIRAIVSLQIRVHVRDTRISSVCIRNQLSLLTREDKALIPTSLQISIIVGSHYANQLCCSHCYPLVR